MDETNEPFRELKYFHSTIFKKCRICGKETDRLNSFYGIYICSDECEKERIKHGTGLYNE